MPHRERAACDEAAIATWFARACETLPSGALSPLTRLAAAPVPVLAVCSSRRVESCPQAQRFVDKARMLGGRADVLREDLSHAEINATLGLQGAYTDAVDTFLQAVGAIATR